MKNTNNSTTLNLDMYKIDNQHLVTILQPQLVCMCVYSDEIWQQPAL